MQENKDEFEEKLLDNTDGIGADAPIEIVETPEMKKAKANVQRILNDIMARLSAPFCSLSLDNIPE